MKYVVLAARLLLGGLFIYASVHKIMNPADFAQAVRNYQMLPPAYSNLAAATLPWIELVAGALIVAGVQTRPSALVIAGMMAVFVAALSSAYYSGLDISCGCFSTDTKASGRIGLLQLIRDSLLLPTAIFVVIADRGDFSILGRKSGQTAEPTAA